MHSYATEIQWLRLNQQSPTLFCDTTPPAMYMLDTRWRQVHNAIHNRETSVNARKGR
jgi:hypothetical protein